MTIKLELGLNIQWALSHFFFCFTCSAFSFCTCFPFLCLFPFWHHAHEKERESGERAWLALPLAANANSPCTSRCQERGRELGEAEAGGGDSGVKRLVSALSRHKQKQTTRIRIQIDLPAIFFRGQQAGRSRERGEWSRARP